MPRQARVKSKTGIYHVMLRGINQQQIFEDKEDFGKILQIIKEYKDKLKFKIYAYCIMGNHVHLLLKENEIVTIGEILKKIGTRFVYWYNIKYIRVGHLFQDRFKSEPVEDEKYLLTVVRYIHQNPVKAGICKSVKDYEYSSYQEYIGNSNIVDTEFIYEYIPKSEFEEYSNIENSDKCLDIENEITIRLTDEQVQKLIGKYTKCNNITEFQALEENLKEKCIEKLYSNGGSIRQISRLTGISKKIVEKWTKFNR